MSTALQRRFVRLEQMVDRVAKPEVFRETVLLAAPAADASSEVKAKFEADKREAMARGCMVIELVGVRPGRIRSHPAEHAPLQ